MTAEPEGGGRASRRLPPGGVFRVGAAFYLVLAVAGLVWMGWHRDGLDPRRFASPRAVPLDLAIGLAAAVLLVAAWEPLRRGTDLARRLEAVLRDALGPMGRDEALGLALLSGLAEETFFRGAVQGAWGLPIATVSFALLHTTRGREGILWLGYALVAGTLFGALVLWRGTLLPAIVAHVAVNAWQLRRLVAAPSR